MSLREVEMAAEWAAAEGWNPGLHDAGCFYAADPGGFLVGLLDGEPIAAISAVKYGEAFGFLGFYIVKPEYRGRGYGLRIWNAGLARLEGRTVGLDGVVAQQENYQRSGFQLAFRSVRQQGVGGGAFPIVEGLVPLSSFSFEEVCAYDRPLFPEPRPGFLKAWLQQPQSVALGVRQGGQLAGYGMARACREGYKVGPLFADTPELAEALFLGLKARCEGGSPIYLDTPANNLPAVELTARHGMKAVFETARMYKGASPALPMGRIFGITSFELG